MSTRDWLSYNMCVIQTHELNLFITVSLTAKREFTTQNKKKDRKKKKERKFLRKKEQKPKNTRFSNIHFPCARLTGKTERQEHFAPLELTLGARTARELGFKISFSL